MHQCQDCGQSFTVGHQNDGDVQPAAQCPDCFSYHTQPYRDQPSPTQSDMAIRNMPDTGDHTDDPGGNPLQEGILGDSQPWGKRDESFGGMISRHISLFETPEFETTEVVAPPDIYRDALKDEATHKATVQIPNGISDNLHATLGNLGAWVENPYENSQLRPYNEYWKSIRPEHMTPGSLRIGVSDPTMAEIINHVAQTDDIAPLQEYRGRTSHVKQAGPALALLPEGAAALLGGGAADAAGAGAADVAGVGGVMKSVAPSLGQGALKQVGYQGMGMLDDAFGLGGGGMPGGGAGGVPVHDTSFYARTAGDEDDANPNRHDEIPKNEDGDHSQQDDGNNHEWQRDISVNGVGGTDHAPSFDSGGPAFQRFMMMLPLLKQMIEGGEDGSEDPLIKGLHESLESELPGYLDHGDENAGHQILMLLSPSGKPSEAPGSPAQGSGEGNEPDHTDENSGGKHESHTAGVTLRAHDGGDFLADLDVELPFRRGALEPFLGPQSPEESALNSANWPESQNQHCPYCGSYGPTRLGQCIHCGQNVYQFPEHEQMANEHWTGRVAQGMPPMPGPPGGMPGPPGEMPPMPGPPGPPMGGPPMAPPPPGGPGTSQGPTTDEQQAWFAKWLQQHGRADEIEAMLQDPALYAKEFARAIGRETPPQAEDAQSAQPPMPAQEEAPPGDTMPVPGMDVSGQMMSAVNKYAADSVAKKCPHCDSHTTELLDAEGNSQCHACGKTFKTDGVVKKDLESTSRTALRLHDEGDQDPVQGVPIADQQGQEDHRDEQDTGHTWLDETGVPLKVGQEYEMYSSKYDIPDLIRIESVKPDALVYTLTGEFGLEHSTELSRQEANIEGITFSGTQDDGELGPEDDGSLEQNNDDNTGYTGPGMRDMSAPSGMVAASVHNSGVGPDYTNPQLDWLTSGMRTAGADYTPYEQRQLIEEMGEARNAAALDLVGTHYVSDAADDQFLFGV